MEFQEFSKNYINISMGTLFEQLFYHHFFCLNLNEALLSGKLSRVLALVKDGSSL